jgi:hypothetical protein
MTVRVLLSGRRGGTTHQAVELLDTLPEELRLIGGLAVMCRVGTPHRATVDLDALARDASVHDQLATVALTAVSGGQYRLAGNFELDVIDVAPVDTEHLIEELAAAGEPFTDLDLNVIAHTWAHDRATPVDIAAADEQSGEVLARAPGRLVASALGLVAMKATTVALRASSKPEKRASDLYDLGRLLVAGGLGTGDLRQLPDVLAVAVDERLRRWFLEDTGRDRTFRDVRRFDEPRLDLDEVADHAETILDSGT